MSVYALTDAELRELHNTLAQPTKYERAQQRRTALAVLRVRIPWTMQRRLDGHDMSLELARIKTLRKKYRITDEEIYVDE